MSKLSHSHPDHNGVYEGTCIRCDQVLYTEEVNIEASEMCDHQPVCNDCADGVFEENGQFGVGE